MKNYGLKPGLFSEGMVEVTAHYYPQTGQPERHEFRWVGGPRGWISTLSLCMMRMDHLRVADLLQIGPYRLVLTKKTGPLTDGFEFVRVQYPSDALVLAWVRLGEIYKMLKYRIVTTLAVWGLAHIPEAVAPSWRDIGRRLDKNARSELRRKLEGLS